MVTEIKNKNWFRRHWILTIIIIFIIMGGIGAIFSEEEIISTTNNQEQAKIYSIGEKIIIDKIDYSVDSVFTSSALGSLYNVEEAKGVFVIISLTVKNNGNGDMSLSTTDFSLIDSQGRNYNPDISASIYLSMMNFNPFTFERLGAGLQTSGELVFDVPINDTGLVLEITGEGFFADSVQVDLEI